MDAGQPFRKPFSKYRAVLLATYPLLLLLSGAAGLAYEVVWLRSLSNTLGSSTLVTSLFLAVFMGGMAVGSLWLGRFAERFRRPLILYAALEGALGLYALALPWLLELVAAVDRLSAAAGVPGLPAKTCVAVAILFPPTFVMGGTLPAVAADLSRRDLRGGPYFTLLYAVHVLGAAGGALLASFVAIPALGLMRTSAAGSMANFAVAAAALALGTRAVVQRTELPAVTSSASAPPRTKTRPRQAEEILGRSQRGGLLVTALLAGFLLLACEVVIVRTLVLALMATVHSFALMLCVFLVALSVGSFIASRLPDSWIRQPQTMCLVLLCAAAGLLVAREASLRVPLPLLMCAYSRDAVDVPEVVGSGIPTYLLQALANSAQEVQPGEYMTVSLLICSATLFPFVVPLGIVLPLVLRRVAFSADGAGRRAGQVLFWNTVGSVLGALSAPFLFIRLFSLQGTLWVFAVAATVAGAAWWATGLKYRPLWPSLVLAGLLVVLVPALASVDFHFRGTPDLDCTRIARARLFDEGSPPKVLWHREGPTATVTVAQHANGRRSLRVEGFEAAGNVHPRAAGYHYMRMMAHLPVLLHGPDRIERALVIGCGAGGTAGAMTLHDTAKVDLVELHPEVFEGLPWFTTWNGNVANNPRCTKIVDDGRAHLRRYEGYYDIITLEPMPPQFSGMTQLYSVEFYQDCRRALRAGGTVCQWLPLHLVTSEQGLALARTMADVFTNVQYWEINRNGFLIGTSQPQLTVGKENFELLLQNQQARRDLEQAGIKNMDTLLSAFVCNVADLREEMRSTEPIRDDYPVLEYAEVGYFLTTPSRAQIAHRYQPYYAASLRAQLPVSGPGDFVQASEARWRNLAIFRFVGLLRNLDQDEARLRLEEQIQRCPQLEAALRDGFSAVFPG